MRTPGFAILRTLPVLLAPLALAQPDPTPTPPATPAPTFPKPADPALAAIRDEVTALLTEMSIAVTRGDAQAYLKCISPRSAFFLVEQREWAKDLGKPDTRPTAFSPVITDDGALATRTLAIIGEDGKPTPPQSVQAFTATVTFRWTMPTKGPAAVDNQSPTVTFSALFLKHPKTGRWQYAGEDFLLLESRHANIYYPKGAENAAKLVAEAFPLAKAHDDEFFGHPINRVEEIRLHNRRDVLQFSVYPSMFQTDTTLSGWSESGESIKFLTTYARDVDGWKAAFAHEYGHVCTWNLGPKAADMPWWVQEGIAELAAEPFAGGRDRVTRQILRWATTEKLAPWDQITDYRNTPKHFRLHPYHQGHHMVGFIDDTFTHAKCLEWLTAIATGKSLDDATKSVLGLPFTDLDARWHKHIAELAETDGAAAPKDPK